MVIYGYYKLLLANLCFLKNILGYFTLGYYLLL
jgi:hypothetical protein